MTLRRITQILSISALLFSTLIMGANTDKVDAQIYDLDSTVKDIMWCGNNNEVILVLSNLGSVYRSRDKG
jgi:photosystem II stability/assembly factor-like uncharacterized protein